MHAFVQLGVPKGDPGAITRYLKDVLPGKSLVPDNARSRARMDMAMSTHDSYGYGALIRLATQHLFPKFVGGKDEEIGEP